MKIKTKFAIFGTIVTIVPVLLANLMIKMQSGYIKLDELREAGRINTWIIFLYENYRQVLALLSIIYIVFLIILGFVFYRSMMRPLNALNVVALNIQDGNLDKKISYNGSDEYKLVFDQFEQMRIKLKDLLLEQIEYEKQRELLFTNIAHDFKTPLTSIKGYAEGIIDGVAKDEKTIEKYLQIIISKAEDLSRMSQQLQYSVDNAKSNEKEEKRAVEIKGLLAEIIEESLQMHDKLKISYNNRDDDDAFATIDEQSLARTIFNIIENSVKYKSSENAIIDIETYQNDGKIVIKISDSGVGIGSGNADKIFERFYRSDSARSSPEKGSGLGLSIAKQLVNDMGGWIWARKKDNGLSIYISLPVLEEA